ncbi:MAG: chorismate synthase, partial [Clostridia bacterium]
DSDFPLLDESVKSKMEEKIANARMNLDSVGGTIECVASGVPIGLGDYMFDSLEGKISQLIFGIPAIKGIEFGDGFDFKGEVGSNANDQMRIQDGKVKIISNHNGGILGGISNGEPLTLAVVVKPTPSISKPQQSVNLVSMQDVTLEIGGRHDACIVPRAVPVVEAVVMLAILDEILK